MLIMDCNHPAIQLSATETSIGEDCHIRYDRCIKGGKTSSGDDHSHHPRLGHALKWTTEKFSKSLAGIHLALYQMFLQLEK